MARERISTRADEDTVDALEEFIESEETPDITKSEALRRFIREGLAQRDYAVAVTDGSGEFHSRLDEIEETQRHDTITKTLAIFLGLFYIAFSLQYDTGLLWAGVGVLVAAVMLVVTFAPSRVGL